MLTLDLMPSNQLSNQSSPHSSSAPLGITSQGNTPRTHPSPLSASPAPRPQQGGLLTSPKPQGIPALPHRPANGVKHQPKARPIFLLSMDGGGILGLMALQVLEYIEQRMNQPISSLFDCITGVSAGGLMALGLVVPHAHGSGPAFSAHDLSKFFTQGAHRIFQKTTAQNLTHKIPLIRSLDNLFFSKYCATGARDFYQGILGQRTLSQALTHTMIPAYNIQDSTHKGPHLKVFDSLATREKKGPGSPDFFMSDIALATSAIPTYFPPHPMGALVGGSRILTKDYCIDGAVAINNPTILAYSDLRRRYPHHPIHVLSLGLRSPRHVYRKILKDSSPGTLAWLGTLGHLLVSPQLSVYEQLFENLKKEAPQSGTYWRIEPLSCDHLWDFDDISPEHLRRIAQRGREMMEHHRHVLDAVVTYLRREKSAPLN